MQPIEKLTHAVFGVAGIHLQDVGVVAVRAPGTGEIDGVVVDITWGKNVELVLAVVNITVGTGNIVRVGIGSLK